MLDRTLIFMLTVGFSMFTFIGMSVLAFWMGKKVKAHTFYASKGLIPAKTWFGYPERDTEVKLARNNYLSFQFFKVVAAIFFTFSLFLALALPVWIIFLYTEVF